MNNLPINDLPDDVKKLAEGYWKLSVQDKATFTINTTSWLMGLYLKPESNIDNALEDLITLIKKAISINFPHITNRN